MGKGLTSNTAALCTILAAAYIVLGRLTFAVSVEYGNVTSVVFAPEGVALAFTILFGARVAPGIVIGQMLLSYWSGPSILGGLGIGLFNCAEGILGGYLFHRWKISHGFDRLRDVGLFVAMIFFILQPISATGGVLVLWLIGTIPPELIPSSWASWWIQGIQKPLPSLELVPSAWAHWWLGNSIGQLMVAPLLIAWLRPAPAHTAGSDAGHTILITSVIGFVVLLTLGDLQSHPLLLLTVIYPVLVWLGLRYGIRVATIVNLLIVPAVTWAAASGQGFMSHLSVPERIAYVGFFIATGSIFMLMLCAMFEERRRLVEQLTDLACKDGLTQISNRRHFVESAERAIAQAHRHGRSLSLMLLDVDHFKQVNDRHGHAVGDLVLAMVGRCCREIARKSDLVGRVGGEEFALLLPETPAKGAQEFAERLRLLIADQEVKTEQGLVRITISAGVSSLGEQDALEGLMTAADRAMYQAKHSGRNRVELAARIP